MIWFEHPPVCVIDWAKPGKIRQVSSVEVAAEELLKWPKTKKREKAATLLADAVAGMADMAKTKKAFEKAAKEADVWVVPIEGHDGTRFFLREFLRTWQGVAFSGQN